MKEKLRLVQNLLEKRRIRHKEHRFVVEGPHLVEEAQDLIDFVIYSEELHILKKLREKGIHVQVLNISCLSDLDIEAILKAAMTGKIITYEDHHIQTGLGSLIANVLVENSLGIHFRKLGITQYGSSGKPDDLYQMQGLDVESLVRVVMEEIKKR